MTQYFINSKTTVMKKSTEEKEAFHYEKRLLTEWFDEQVLTKLD